MEPMVLSPTTSQTASSKPGKAKGTCRVCHAILHLHNKDGTLHKHGPRKEPCPGSNQPPLTPTNSHRLSLLGISTSSCGVIPQTQSQAKEPEQTCSSDINIEDVLIPTTTIKHPDLPYGLLRHIPKGARTAAAHLLTDIIGGILKEPLLPAGWVRLLSFGSGTLEKPTRGGKRHNLTQHTKTRIDTFKNDWQPAASLLFGPVRDRTDKGKPKKPHHAHSIAAAVAAKLEDGNLSAAARILCSDDSPAPINKETLELLRLKHPPAPEFSTTQPASHIAALQITETAVRVAMRSFPKGSSGGPDGLRPQHVLELLSDPAAGQGLLKAVTALTNLLLAGTCPQELRPILFGGTLFALKKSSGGLRPIVIGYLWRRLASKCANAYIIPIVTPRLCPKQLGVGVPGGSEAAIHATRRFMDHMSQDTIIIKLDLANAFNSLHRDIMLSSLSEWCPELSAYCQLSYAKPSILQYGNFTLESQEGPQQGDPLGPVLFCLPLQEILSNLQSPLAFGYLDDLTVGGGYEMVCEDVAVIKKGCARLGLSINESKCEVISKDANLELPYPATHFRHIDPSSAELLGAPLSQQEALNDILNSVVSRLTSTMNKLEQIPRQDALLILRCSIGAPRLIHILRCAPCHDHPGLTKFDEGLRAGTESILNIALSDDQWLQASMPIRMGGLGIRRASSLALPAFLASAASSQIVQSLILANTRVPSDSYVEIMRTRWLQSFTESTDCPATEGIQSSWDTPLLSEAMLGITSRSLDSHDQARLNAIQAPHASDWLFALPLAAQGLRLYDEEMRVAVGLRLGAVICVPHKCTCDTLVSARGLHGMACKMGFGRQARHSSINDIVLRSLIKAGTPSIREPSGLTRLDGKRPDGQTLIPWSNGRSLIWDVTIIDTFAPSYLIETSAAAGGAAEIAATRKKVKYAELQNRYRFTPIAIETMGPMDREGSAFISELGRRLSKTTEDTQETFYLFQKISVTIQRFNAIACLGTMGH
jgi:Reverse transcriptase (RNA-dependent DNA polymerase)